MTLPTQLDPASEAYAASRAAMIAALEEISAATEDALGGGGPRYVGRHLHRGRLLVRDRINRLLDRYAPFLELSALAGWGTGDVVGASVVTGIGQVSGVECMIIANDPTVRGGSMNPSTVAKIRRALDIAHRTRLPTIQLVESGGADLPRQADIFVPGGEIFKQISRLSAARIPTVAIVFGSSTAGGAYVPGMSDYIVMVASQARVYLGGPPLVKMAIDEDADEEQLGGAEMHSRISGVSDYLARDEEHALSLGRAIVANLGWRKLGPPPRPDAPAPRYPAEELLGVVPADAKRPFDIREVIARVVDGSQFEEFKPDYGSMLVTGWAQLVGYPIGIIANNGILFSEEAQKGTHFIQLANQLSRPLLFIQNITGFMVGTRYEQGGIIKHGAQLINAVSNSTVPHLTLMVGASYGAGNYAMSGRAFDPRFVFTWPTHRIAVMGGRQLAGVLSIVRRAAASQQGLPFDERADADLRAATEDQIDTESTALFATGRLWDDGVIDPRDTRIVLGLALSAVHSAPVEGSASYAVFRM
jgi:acetyl-CoA carboxylase carboxyltransferase component